MTVYKSFDDVNKTLFQIAKLKSVVVEKEAKMNNKINAIKEKYNSETLEEREQIKAYEIGVEEFCKANKNEFDKTRTKKLLFGSVGFRTGTPKVKLLNRRYNWKTVLENVNTIFKGKYTRKVEEIAKDKILSDYASGTLSDEKVASVGIVIDKGETIKIEINWENFNEAE